MIKKTLRRPENLRSPDVSMFGSHLASEARQVEGAADLDPQSFMVRILFIEEAIGIILLHQAKIEAEIEAATEVLRTAQCHR